MAQSVRNPKSEIRNLSSYWERTHWPLQSLYFLLPLLILYELGVVLWAGPYDISARRLLRAFFELFGGTGYYLPGLAVVVVLLCWHIARRDPWKPELKLYGLMWLESIALAAPLFVFMAVLFREPAQPAIALSNGGPAELNGWRAGLVFSIGAGIYEELLFRLIAIALLHLLLVDVLSLPTQYGAVGAVALSAVAFAMYHFSDGNPFDWGRFAFYTAAGLYFAAVYVLRGFGIVAAVHAIYDVAVIVTMQLQG